MRLVVPLKNQPVVLALLAKLDSFAKQHPQAHLHSPHFVQRRRDRHRGYQATKGVIIYYTDRRMSLGRW